ncbi:MAG: GNAT family N-acetyltransferase [Vagococcus sp.]|uniref:GNAT family N-acetyltransferase n=1 Tax=Vagococcus sp. TaxID=1933889 RepID=UPI002FCA8134
MMLREMTRKDNQGVKALVQRSLKLLGLDKPGTAYYDPELNDLYSFYQKENKGNYWVIEENGVIVGGVGIASFNEIICELQKLYVDTSVQGKGLASQLMNQALLFAENNYEACYLETHSDLGVACQLYDKYEFDLLSGPLEGSVHSAMDKWYLKKFK